MTLHQIARAQSVKRTDTCKLFWGKYAFSLKTTIPEVFHEDRREGLHQFWITAKNQKWHTVRPTIRQIHGEYRQTLQNYVDAIIDKNYDTLSLDDFYQQSGDKNTVFYVSTEEIAATLLRDNPGLFHTYAAPQSERVHERLKEIAGQKIEVRDKGWYGEYDHKIVFKWKFKYGDLDEKVEVLNFENSLYSKGDSRILYVTGDDDFFLAKLALADRIESVIRRLTVDDINADETIIIK